MCAAALSSAIAPRRTLKLAFFKRAELHLQAPRKYRSAVAQVGGAWKTSGAAEIADFRPRRSWTYGTTLMRAASVAPAKVRLPFGVVTIPFGVVMFPTGDVTGPVGVLSDPLGVLVCLGARSKA